MLIRITTKPIIYLKLKIMKLQCKCSWSMLSINRNKNKLQVSLVAIAIYVLPLLGVNRLNAQVIVPSTSTEINYPNAPINPIVPSILSPVSVPGLFCNAHRASVAGFSGDAPGGGNYIAETASWTEDNGLGWEDGYFTYGYTDNSGIYTPVGTEFIAGAKHLSAAYMEISGQSYIIVAYTTRAPVYNEFPIGSGIWLISPYFQYSQEYRIYDWASPTSAVSFAKRGRISSGVLYPYPPSHPLYLPPSDPLYPACYEDFAYDGTIVMDVNYDADKVAFAWTGNGGGVQLTAGTITPGNPPMLNCNYAPLPIAFYPSVNPLDIAFRHDPTIGASEDYIHTLIFDGINGYYVTQFNYDYVFGTSIFPIIAYDEATFSTSAWYGPNIFHKGHMKLDVPDISSERRWAYTWTDGTHVFLKRFMAPSSSSTTGTSIVNVVNDGSLNCSTKGMSRIANLNAYKNEMPAIAYKKDTSTSILLGWRTTATSDPMLSSSGYDNWVSVVLQEGASFTAPPIVVSDYDYLDVQNNSAVNAHQYLAMSHHTSTTSDFLYNTFTTDDGNVLLYHQNHYTPVSSTWRLAPKGSTVTQGLEQIKVGPNPFAEELKIELNSKANISVHLTDIAGKVLCRFKGTPTEVNQAMNNETSRWVSGTYFLYVLTDNGTQQVFKLTKQ
jgi:hypothetical protein